MKKEIIQIYSVENLNPQSKDLFGDIHLCFAKMENKDILVRQTFCNSKTKEFLVNSLERMEWYDTNPKGFCDENKLFCSDYVVDESLPDMQIILMG